MKPRNVPPAINKTALNALRVQLRRLNKLYSWRKMAGEIYNSEVSHSVLQRLATDKEYIPADAAILQALDLIKKPNPFRSLPRWYYRTPAALEYVQGKRAQIKGMADEAKAQRKSSYTIRRKAA